MDSNYRIKLQEWIVRNLDELNDEQLQKLADYFEGMLNENWYKDYL